MRRLRTIGAVLVLLVFAVQAHAQQRQRTSTYVIPTDVQAVGGGEEAESDNYILDDTIGEPNIGLSRSDTYDLNAGYRQTLETFLGLGCSASVELGTIAFVGQRTASGTCLVTTDAAAGYSLTWGVVTGSGGANTGSLISPDEETIPGFLASRTSLVAHWRLDETAAGSTVKDVSGSGYDGTPDGTSGANNKPQPSTDVPSPANFRTLRSLDFEGTDDYVNFGNVFNTDSSFTMAAWVRADSTAGTFPTLVAKSGNASDFDLLINSSTSKYAFYLTTAAGNKNVNSTTSVDTAAWQHVAVTWSRSSGELSIYVDGALENTTTGVTGARVVNVNDLCMGKSCHWSNRFFNGRLDDVRIYARDLSAAEVTALYNEPQAWSIPTTTAYWGGRLSSRSTDTDAKWGTDGSSDKWLHVGDGSYPVISRPTRTSTGGSLEILEFRAEVGSSAIQPAGTYTTDVILTASAL